MKPSTQDLMGRFSARWGCYATGYINILEVELNRSLSLPELQQIIGIWFMNESVALSNYKSHTRLHDELGGWSQKADPEWHFLIVDKPVAMKSILEMFMLTKLRHEYEFLVMATEAGRHFVLRVDGKRIINPTPGLVGPVIETRRVHT